MSVATSERLGLWIRATGIVALVALAWAVFAPDGPFWTAVLAAGLMGAVLATAGLVRAEGFPRSRGGTSAEAKTAVARGGE